MAVRSTGDTIDFITGITDFINDITNFITGITDFIIDIVNYVNNITDFITNITDIIIDIANYITGITNFITGIIDYFNCLPILLNLSLLICLYCELPTVKTDLRYFFIACTVVMIPVLGS